MTFTLTLHMMDLQRHTAGKSHAKSMWGCVSQQGEQMRYEISLLFTILTLNPKP